MAQTMLKYPRETVQNKTPNMPDLSIFSSVMDPTFTIFVIQYTAVRTRSCFVD
jgi:hypothetical protein